MAAVYRDLTAEELKYCDRDILAQRLAAIQQHREQLAQEIKRLKVITLTSEIVWAVETAADNQGDIILRCEAKALARAAFKAAGFLVVDQ